MAPRTKPFPDIELMMTSWMPGPLASDLAGLTGESPRVLTIVPLPVTETIVRVTRAAGANRDLFVDRPIVDFDVFSPDNDTAAVTATTIQNLLFSLRGTDTGKGIVLRVDTLLGPHWLPDQNQELSHWGSSYEIYCRASTA